MLHFGAKPPLSFERLIQLCQGIICDEDTSIIKITAKEAGYIYKGRQPTLSEWHLFDMVLRNELAKIRSSRKHKDPLKFVRDDVYPEPYISRIAMNAHRSPSILEAEKILDEARWQVLDTLAIGHYFDIDFLITYAYKLLILEKWERIRSADAPAELERALSRQDSLIPAR